MRQRLLKSLRIAVTAASLLVCALLIVLWVRSYSGTDYLGGGISESHSVEALSYKGFIALNLHLQPYCVSRVAWVPRDEWEYAKWDVSDAYSQSWELELDGNTRFVDAPHWFYLTIFATIAALPWIKWRFSLRTLLIVLTLFAVFFGAIAMTL